MATHVKITPGMMNKFSSGCCIKLRCKECSLAVPVYKGRYPSCCSHCGGELLSEEPFSESKILEFIHQKKQILNLHNFSEQCVLRDVLRFYTIPLLESLRFDTKNLIECLYAINRPTFRKASSQFGYLIEASLYNHTDTVSVTHGIKAACLCTEFILSEAELPIVCREASKLYYSKPAWLCALKRNCLAQDRELQILSEAYVFARPYFSHEKSIEYAYNSLKSNLNWLTEGLWVNDKPPGLVTNTNDPDKSKWVSGGFRFNRNTNKTTKGIQDFQKKILSRRNKVAGLGSRIASIKQILQRRGALRKAKDWHKSSPYSGAMHQGLGQLLHRSNGLYQKTQECCTQLKHLHSFENSLRLFSDGKEYTSGKILGFSIDKKALVESKIEIGKTYQLKGDLFVASRRVGDKPKKIPGGSEIKVITTIPAAQWSGDFPQNPIGKFVYEVEVLSGDMRNENLEVDGNDLASNLGLDECFLLLDTALQLQNSITGVVYVQTRGKEINEAVFSAFDTLLTEQQVGVLLYKIKKKFDFMENNCKIRVYNDLPSMKFLNEEIFESKAVSGMAPVVVTNFGTLYEKTQS